MHLRDDSQLLPTTPAPTRRLPVLFVHGHNFNSDQDTDFNYQKNWQDATRVSFKPTLELSGNAGLDIEDYYIRFQDQSRSISEDATDISDAIDLILHRHDPNYAYPYVSGQTTNVKVVIIAYSKGTLSSRLYLKSLQTNLTGMPPPRPGFNPISEFIALAPPNHGIATAFGTTCAAQQMMNGRSALTCRQFGQFGTPSPASCGSFPSGGLDFITNLNTPDEAPGSRPATNNSGVATPPTQGILYVTIFADASNPDFVGGMNPPNPNTCLSRPMAANQSANALNIPVAIAGAGETEVHGNTPHTPLVICKALFAAVHHRSPATENCSLAANATDAPIVPPPARATAVLSLDFSGSMSVPACPSCATRAVLLKDAVELFVQLWSAVSVPSDRIGVNYFRTNIDDTFNVGGDSTPLLLNAGDDVITSVSSQTPSNNTAMGGGIKRAIQTLNGLSDTPIRRVVLFTDGMQNVNPMVGHQGNQLVISDEAGRPNSNVPGSPALVLDTSGGISIDTIGIGVGEDFVGLLQEIASATGGRTWPTADPAFDLRRFFVEELINALKGFSPQLVAYRHGTLTPRGSNESFSIENGAKKLVLKVSCRHGNTVDFSVDRNGVDVTSAGRFINGAFYKIFVIDFGARTQINSRGTWRVNIKGKASTEYEAAAIVDSETVRYDAFFDQQRPRVGNPLELVVRLASGVKSVSRNARVTVTLSHPGISLDRVLNDIKREELRSFESNLSIKEQKQLALSQNAKRWNQLKTRSEQLIVRANDKGEFRARIQPRIPGIYTAVVTLDGLDDRIGRFSRTVTAITVVRSAR
ncbi:MAG: hypothetical protein C5B55_09995 [Blastocatellia bacterium]|nr:MAG: hypothetical protein C5B55_09995 [Blastocatellia bacterium]